MDTLEMDKIEGLKEWVGETNERLGKREGTRTPVRRPAPTHHPRVAGPAPEAFGSTWAQGLESWHPPILRVLNPFLALVSPNFKVLGGFGAENLRT